MLVPLGPLAIHPGSEERLQQRGDLGVGGRRHLLDLPQIEVRIQVVVEGARLDGLQHLPSGHDPDPGRAAEPGLFQGDPQRLVPEVVDRRRASADVGGHRRVQGVRPARRATGQHDLVGRGHRAPRRTPPTFRCPSPPIRAPLGGTARRSRTPRDRGWRRRPAADRPATCSSGRRRPRAPGPPAPARGLSAATCLRRAAAQGLHPPPPAATGRRGCP